MTMQPAPSPAPRVIVGGIPVDVRTADQWCELLLADWRRKQADPSIPPKLVTTANGQVVSLFASDPVYRAAVLKVDHVAADGMSIVHASRLRTRTPLPERVATTDWFHDAARLASREGLKFYMLGATAEANAQAVARARRLYPDLPLVGARDGYFKDEDLPAIAQDVRRSGADVLWIGVGNPRQVLVGHKFKTLIPELTWIRTCGGLFDFLSGERARAPEMMQKIGLEWAWRAAQEPQRLLWRYLTTNVHSTWRLLAHSRSMNE